MMLLLVLSYKMFLLMYLMDSDGVNAIDFFMIACMVSVILIVVVCD